jgi:RNA polymerase sigma factor (sigma-70 family)
VEADADAGDPRAAFCLRESTRLTGALTLYCGDQGLAEELAQEALARAWLDWPRVATMDAPGAWVHRVAINLANRHYRRRPYERLARDGWHREPVHHDPDSADAAAIRQAVAALPARQRTALILRHYSDLPVADVADVLGCREGTVNALAHQAITALRETGLRDLEESSNAG